MRKLLVQLLLMMVVISAQAHRNLNESLDVTPTAQQTSIDTPVNTLSQFQSENEEISHCDERCTKVWKRSKYFNFYYGKDQLDIRSDEPMKFDADIHAGFGVGKTFYLHKKPLAKIIKFGLDWTYFQIDYTKYSYTDSYSDYIPGSGEPGDSPLYPGYSLGYNDYYADEKIDMHKAEIGMQFGPSITINPVNYLKVNAYFRYAPTASIFYNGDEVSAAYGSYFVSGFAVSYKVISLGMEGRWGQAKHDDFISDYYGDDYTPSYGPNYDEEPATPKCKFKNSGFRFYLSFRF